MRKYIEKSIHLIKIYLNFEKILESYTRILSFLSQTLNITIHYLYKTYEAQAKIPAPSIISLFTFLFRLGVYSQLVVMFGIIIPFPDFLLEFAKTVIKDYTNGYLFLRATIRETFFTLKDSLLDISNLRHENSSIKKLLEDQEKLLQTINREHEKIHKMDQTRITDLLAGDNVQKEINRKLSVENMELSEVLKQTKTTTELQKKQENLMLLGNAVFLIIQTANAYNAIFGSGASVDVSTLTRDIAILKDTVNTLIGRLNTQQVNQTASDRAARSAASSGEPAPGLTDERTGGLESLIGND